MIFGTNVTCIGDYAFCQCIMLTSVDIPTNVTSIGSDSFAACVSLGAMRIPDNVTSIGEYAFSSCLGLTQFNTGNGLSEVSSYMLYGCGSLTNLTLGTNVVNIDGEAFEGCNFASIVIPQSVAGIGGYDAFGFCYNLKGVYFQGNAPLYGWSSFFDDNNPTIYYFPGTSGWDSPFDGLTTVPWLPLMQINTANFASQTNHFGFNITWIPGQQVIVKACTNLLNPVWQPISTNTLTGGTSYFSDTQCTNYPRRFYRVDSP